MRMATIETRNFSANGRTNSFIASLSRCLSYERNSAAISSLTPHEAAKSACHSSRSLARHSNEGRRRQPTKQEGLRRVLGEQVAMEAPVPACLMGQRETIVSFHRGVLLRIEALVDHDPGLVEDCSEDIGVTR